MKHLNNRKMRRAAAIALVLLLSLSLWPSALAAEAETKYEVEYLEDGSYFITEIAVDSSAAAPFATSSTVTSSKKATAYSASGEALWYVKVTGTFTYGNGTAVCTASSVTAGSYQSNWQITSQSASRSGSSATATATAAQKILGITIKTQSKSVTLTCSPTGAFS